MDFFSFWQEYWARAAGQDAEALRSYFREDARIRWHNTNEEFTTEEFLRANCEYPGSWHGDLSRAETIGQLVVTVCRIWSEESSFHVVSFFHLEGGKIQTLDEYWGDDGPPPRWRRELGLGRPIRTEKGTGQHEIGAE